jgi:hypothetical protein
MPNNFKIDPRKQFSKRLARWTAVFWFFYMTWLSVIMLLEPQAALFCVYMGILVTVVMIFMTVAYTKNSIAEKMAYAMLDKTKLELSLKGIGKAIATGSSHSNVKEVASDEEDLNEDTEGDDNG